jgi:hypothetical protein
MRTRLSEPDRETPEAAPRSHLVLWCAIGFLSAAVAGLYWIVWRDHLPLSQIPGIRRTLGSMDGRMAVAEERLRRWEEEAPRPSDTVAKASATVRPTEARQPAGRPARRVDFEVATGRSQQLAPGISLGVTGVDVARRRVDGWMWIMPDRRTVWLRRQDAAQPVVFHSSADGRRREVVFTRVTTSGVAGYLLLPGDA